MDVTDAGFAPSVGIAGSEHNLHRTTEATYRFKLSLELALHFELLLFPLLAPFSLFLGLFFVLFLLLLGLLFFQFLLFLGLGLNHVRQGTK